MIAWTPGRLLGGIVRSGRGDAVDEHGKVGVLPIIGSAATAGSRSDVQHLVTSATLAPAATVTLRIAGVDRMLHPDWGTRQRSDDEMVTGGGSRPLHRVNG
jgi:hypothetical protein